MLQLMILYEAIRDCLARKQHLPTLILLYAGIDIVASIEARPGERVNEYFNRWVESYLMPTGLLKCTAVELYAARCGIVHSMTPESDLSRGGKARMIYYAWGSSEAIDLDQTFVHLKQRDLIVALQIEQLLEAFRIGMLAWEAEVNANPERLKEVEVRSKKWFVNAPSSLIKDFLSIHPQQ